MTEGHGDDRIDLLLVEDNPGDVRLIQEAFTNGHEHRIHVVTDGEEALDFMYRRGDHPSAPRPDIILLDLNLPRVGGTEVLAETKADPDLKQIPVIVLTGSEAEKDVIQSYQNHANACLTKPVDPNEFISLIRSFEEFWIEMTQLPPETIESHGH